MRKSKEYLDWLNTCPELEPLNLEEVNITYFIYYPDLRQRDSKNYLKVVDDYLVSQKVIIDDKWTVLKDESIKPRLDRDNPRIEVYLS